MSYNNLLYLLVVILLLSIKPIADQAALPLWQGGLLFVAKFGLFHLCCRLFFSVRRVLDVRKYLRAEKFLSLLALVFLAVDIFLLDCLSYLSLLPFARSLPIIARFFGLLLFFAYLADVWLVASSRSVTVFGRRATGSGRFIFENIRSNLPIVLPWLFISLVLDILNVLPVPAIRRFMDSGSGEVVIMAVFFLFIALVFPPLLMRIWGCRPMAAGERRDHMAAFCQRYNLRYRDIMIWPLFGGQMVTAGVVGFIGRFRYILVTPGLLANLNIPEIDAVLAHEIGHVKRYHMQLYLLVLIGFSILVNPLDDLLLYLVSGGDWFYRLGQTLKLSHVDLFGTLFLVSLLLLLVLFLRFGFGFFMRNFERQADLYAFSTLGGGRAISAALEKVAWLSGNIRDLPSWHHFGISQRVEFLAACDENPALVAKHHHKVYLALGLYGAMILCAAGFHLALPKDFVEQAVYKRDIVKIEKLIALQPDRYQLYFALGEVLLRSKAYGEAIDAYEHSMMLAPENPEVLNNLAWLLITCEDERFINGSRGLLLATKAASLKPAPHILDTLAHGYWLKGEKNKAVDIEKQALALARPENKKIYAEQIRVWQKLMGRTGDQGLEF